MESGGWREEGGGWRVEGSPVPPPPATPLDVQKADKFRKAVASTQFPHRTLIPEIGTLNPGP